MCIGSAIDEAGIEAAGETDRSCELCCGSATERWLVDAGPVPFKVRSARPSFSRPASNPEALLGDESLPARVLRPADFESRFCLLASSLLTPDKGRASSSPSLLMINPSPCSACVDVRRFAVAFPFWSSSGGVVLAGEPEGAAVDWRD